MSSLRFDDQSSIRSTAKSFDLHNELPRSTSTENLFAFPPHTHKRPFHSRENGAGLAKSTSITNLALIPEHKTHHRMTPYQIQRSHMKQSFQFPNGENFTPRRQLSKSASSISLHKQRHIATQPSVAPMPRSSSMVTVSLPQHQQALRSSVQAPSMGSQGLPVGSFQRHHISSNHLRHVASANDAKSNTHVPSLTGAKFPDKSSLTASSLQFNRLQAHQSQVSISSFSNKHTTSSNDSQSTDTSIKEICDPGSATSTDLSDEELTKKILSSVRAKKMVNTNSPFCKNSTVQTSSNLTPTQETTRFNNSCPTTSGLVRSSIEPTLNSPTKKSAMKTNLAQSAKSVEPKKQKPIDVTPVKKSSSRLGSFFKKLLPFMNRPKKEIVPKVLPRKTAAQNQTRVPELPVSPADSELPSLLHTDIEDDLEDDGFKDLMDIDLVFDSLLLKSEQHQQNSNTTLVNTNTKNTERSSQKIEPPLRSSKRPLLVKDYQGKFTHRYNNSQVYHCDRIIEHLHQNWKAVHFNSVVPAVARSNDSSMSSSEKKCRFNEEIYVNDTFSAMEYVRSDKNFPESRRKLLKSRYIDGIKMELNDFKKTEMLVHPNSSQYTHFFL
ncbi:unnamed protein product [Kluyveromyces dobzhanskii CBS 2104]|uniref:WGS project CCBQ000000000 data, contig 00015 n=1 Tax=Kluyveromyces dobzhanskii CBS 2104 TaxID=1427455 RepID=A0A0A8LB12_9SACH|nr:unnamed protein product [Kluyveromyces dobzhanskii CBS 2104]